MNTNKHLYLFGNYSTSTNDELLNVEIQCTRLKRRLS